MSYLLRVNAHLKYVEFLLYIFDTGSDELSLGDIKKQFKNRFNTLHPLLNQNFGVYRLLPLILIKEEYKNQKKELSGDVKKIKTIRDAIAHSNFSISEKGYSFKNDKTHVDFTYEEFNAFLHRIENNFYRENN